MLDRLKTSSLIVAAAVGLASRAAEACSPALRLLPTPWAAYIESFRTDFRSSPDAWSDIARSEVDAALEHLRDGAVAPALAAATRAALPLNGLGTLAIARSTSAPDKPWGLLPEYVTESASPTSPFSTLSLFTPDEPLTHGVPLQVADRAQIDAMRCRVSLPSAAMRSKRNKDGITTWREGEEQISWSCSMPAAWYGWRQVSPHLAIGIGGLRARRAKMSRGAASGSQSARDLHRRESSCRRL